MSTMERRVARPGLSPREAAVVTGLSEKTIQQAIDRQEVRPLPARREGDRERTLDAAALLYLRMRKEVGRLLSPEGKRRLLEKLNRAFEDGEKPRAVDIGPVRVDVGPEAARLDAALARLDDARARVHTDPAVRAGEPVVRGTRVPVHLLADLAAQGATREELLEDYPSLTPADLDAALLFARVYPRRGRPRRAPWKDGVVVRKASS